MNPPSKIAIYSGVLPSTTFIERLIHGLSKYGLPIYLFGILEGAPRYSENVHVLGYRQSHIFKAFYLLKYGLLLSLYKSADKCRLDAYLRSQNRYTLYERVKCYPVLWYQPAVFHLQWAKGLEDWIWVQEFGMKLVLSLRGAHINYSPIADLKLAAMYREQFPNVAGFHAVSKAIGREAQQYGAAPERIQVVYSGLPVEPLISSAPKKNNGLQLISVGRSHWIKGYTYALDACRLLKDQGFQFHYTIVGGHGDIELQYQIHDLGLQDHVQLMKQQPYETVQTMMRGADLLLLPSIEEGIANVVLEAMALGTLVLTTDCGGMNEVIQEGVNGFIVRKRDSNALAEAVLRISRLSAAEAKSILEAALRTIKEQHTEQQMVEGMMGCYQRAINEIMR